MDKKTRNDMDKPKSCCVMAMVVCTDPTAHLELIGLCAKWHIKALEDAMRHAQGKEELKNGQNQAMRDLQMVEVEVD